MIHPKPRPTNHICKDPLKKPRLLLKRVERTEQNRAESGHVQVGGGSSAASSGRAGEIIGRWSQLDRDKVEVEVEPMPLAVGQCRLKRPVEDLVSLPKTAKSESRALPVDSADLAGPPAWLVGAVNERTSPPTFAQADQFRTNQPTNQLGTALVSQAQLVPFLRPACS